MQERLHFHVLRALVASSAAGLMCGCSGSFATGPIQPHEAAIGNIQGSVHSDQAPMSGAKIYLFATGEGGYAANPVSLISSTAPDAFEDGNGHYYVVTDANGNFALGGDYTCTAGQRVYVLALSDNPDLRDTPNNTETVQMAGLGRCPAAGNMAAQVPYLVINEVTTAAFEYAMGGLSPAALNVSSNVANNREAFVTQSPGLATPTATRFYGGDTVITNTVRSQITTTQNGNPGTKP
jgi:hypothetical protein